MQIGETQKMDIENEDKNHEINSNKEAEIVGGNSK